MTRTRRRADNHRVCMLMRGSARNHPRVLKEAISLADGGCRVTIITTVATGETRRVERLAPGVIVVRVEPRLGLLQFLAKFDLRQQARSPIARTTGDSPLLPKWRLALMMVSRSILAIRIASTASRTKPRVVHAHDFSTLPAAWLLGRTMGIPIVYDAHEVNVSREGYYRQLVPIIMRVEGCLIADCDTVITTTSLRARHFRRVYSLKTTPVVLQNRPRLVSHSPSDVRTRLNIPPGQLLSVYQGGFQEGRGLHNYIRAISRAPAVHALLIGTGHQEDSLRTLVRELGLDSRVHFHGQVALEEVPSITAAADVGVQVLRNTSFNHWSTDSNKLFEYGLGGLAVVASDFPEIRRIIREYEFGLLVDPESVGAIAAALVRLRDDRALLLQLRESARRATEALSWSSQERVLLCVYEELGVLDSAQPSDRQCEQPHP